MKRGKYLVTGLMLGALVITGLLATAGWGPRQPDVQQWEYANYFTTAIPGRSAFTGGEHPMSMRRSIYDFNDRDSELKFWQRVGFKFGNKDMFASDWLNFLGHQGWELVSVTRNTNSDTIEYWFKRPKQ